MPILPREPDLFPPDLFQSGNERSQQGWWAMYTLSRREKELMRRLRSIEIPFYCPLIAKKTRSPSGRVRTSHIPLFPGYVFVQGNDEQRYRALTTNCVSRTLPVTDGQELLSDLRQVHQLIESNAPLTQESRIKPGARVRVISGPLLGLEGTVLERRGIERLLVTVEFLQKGASVAIEDFQVESI